MKIGFIGGGNMASAIIGGMIEKKVYTNKNLQYTYPKATSHWEETASKNDAAAVARQITNYLKSR